MPLTILAAHPDDQYLLLELGTNAPGEIERLARLANPHIAVITAIGRSHLERLGTVEDVLREKAALLRFVKPVVCCILPFEHPAILNFAGDATVRSFGATSAADLRLTARGVSGDGRFWFEVNGGAAFSLRLPPSLLSRGRADRRLKTSLSPRMSRQFSSARVRCVIGRARWRRCRY